MKEGRCKRCHRNKKIKARGLCSACYKKTRIQENGHKQIILVDFSEFPEVLQELKHQAAQNMRPIEWEIMARLKGTLAPLRTLEAA